MSTGSGASPIGQMRFITNTHFSLFCKIKKGDVSQQYQINIDFQNSLARTPNTLRYTYNLAIFVNFFKLQLNFFI